MTRRDLEYTRSAVGDVDLGHLRSPEVEKLETWVRPGLLDPYSSIELRVAVAMSVLTPDLDWDDSVVMRHKTIVGCADVDDRIAHADSELTEILLKRAVDCAVAYGLGWRRDIKTGQPRTIDQRWPRAFSWMLLQFADAVVEANRFLADSVNCLQMAGGLDYLENTDTVFRVANTLLNWYLDGTVDALIGSPMTVSCCPTGATARSADGREWEIPEFSKLVLEPQEGGVHIPAFKGKPPLQFTDNVAIRASYLETTIKRLRGPRNAGEERLLSDADVLLLNGAFEELECSCGSFYCPNRHRLETWQPEAGLQESILVAVRGELPSPHANSFGESMYGAYHARGGLLHDDGRPWGRILQGRFETAPEPRQNPAGELREYVGTTEFLFFLSAEPTFEPHPSRKCKNRIGSSKCECVLQDAQTACPFCDAVWRNGRTTLIWRSNPRFPPQRLIGYDARIVDWNLQ